MTGRHAIVLAGGAGRRFGGGKLTAPWRGRPLLVWALEAALQTRVDSVVLVLGADAEAVAGVVERGLAGARPDATPGPASGVREDRLHLVIARDWANGLSASLRAGIAALPQTATAVAVFLGDMPLVRAEDADVLLDAVAAGAPAARLRHPGGPAHPVAFGRRLFADLVALRGDRGAAGLLSKLGAAVAEIPSNHPGAILDVDRRQDLENPWPDRPLSPR